MVFTDIGYLFSAFYNDRMTEDVCQGMNIKSFVDWLEVLNTHLSLTLYILLLYLYIYNMRIFDSFIYMYRRKTL